MLKFALLLPVVILVSVGLLACGGDDDEPSNAAPTAAAVQPTQSASGSGSPEQSGGGGTTVTIIDFGYAPDALTARAGQQLTLNLINNGQAPHTFTITGVVDSGTLNGGESKAVSFTPSSAGTLEFFCTIHGASTMSGRITVQ